MKKIFLLLLLPFSLAIQSQELVGSMSVKLNKKSGEIKQFCDSNNNLLLILSDEKNVTLLKYTADMKLKDSITYAKPDNTIYSGIIGHKQDGEDIETVYWSSYDVKNIQIQTVNFKTRKIENKFFGMEYPKEESICEFISKGNLYVVRVPKKSNKLKFYIFGNGNYVEQKIIDFEDNIFEMKNGVVGNFYDIITDKPYGSAFTSIISNISNSSLTSSYIKSKIYIKDNVFNITFDNAINYTELVSINLDNFTKTIKLFDQPKMEFNEYYEVDSNSFLHNNLVYQIKSTKEQLAISIKQLDGKEVKFFSAGAQENIAFKNGDIYKHLGDSGKIKIIEDTETFLRKIKSQRIAIVVNTINDKLYITYGSISDLQQSATQTVGAQFGLIGSLIAVAIDSFQDESINPYNGRFAYYTNLLTDVELNQLKGSMPKLGTEKIEDFYKANPKLTLKGQYKSKNQYFLTTFDKKSSNLNFYKFEDEK